MPDATASPEDHDDAAGRWVIVVRSEGDQGVPIAVRVKRWLKCGLRGFGLRCESVGPTTLVDELARSRAARLDLEREVDRLRRALERSEQRAERRHRVPAGT